MAAKTKSVDDNYVRMYYEHQYDRIGKHEDNRLTITNYILTMSALAFTFGYQNATQLTIINGIGLPVFVMLVNMFSILYIERTAQLVNLHQDRAHAILETYAPELLKINEKHVWRRSSFLHTKRGMQKGIHFLIILVALIPVVVYLYQFI